MVDLPLCWVVVSTWWLLLMEDHLPDDFWRNSWISMDEPTSFSKISISPFYGMSSHSKFRFTIALGEAGWKSRLSSQERPFKIRSE